MIILLNVRNKETPIAFVGKDGTRLLLGPLHFVQIHVRYPPTMGRVRKARRQD